MNKRDVFTFLVSSRDKKETEGLRIYTYEEDGQVRYQIQHWTYSIATSKGVSQYIDIPEDFLPALMALLTACQTDNIPFDRVVDMLKGLRLRKEKDGAMQ